MTCHVHSGYFARHKLLYLCTIQNKNQSHLDGILEIQICNCFQKSIDDCAKDGGEEFFYQDALRFLIEFL